MPTPSKPFVVLAAEKKSHRTKAELEQRKEAEESLITGKHMNMWPEVKVDDMAAKEFKRVRALLGKIGKDDALHEGVINRYAMLRSECSRYELLMARLDEDYKEAVRAHRDSEIGFIEYMQLSQKISANINAADKQLQSKRKMLLDIEKENIMTIASALRSIPKKVEKKTESGIAAFTARRNDK